VKKILYIIIIIILLSIIPTIPYDKEDPNNGTTIVEHKSIVEWVGEEHNRRLREKNLDDVKNQSDEKP